MSTTEREAAVKQGSVPSPVITEMRSLGHRWGDGNPLFDQLDLDLAPGVHLVCGDEQTGKSTLLNILSGELQPTSGWVSTLGMRADQQNPLYRGAVFHTHVNDPALDKLPVEQWFEQQAQARSTFRRDWLADGIQEMGLAPHVHKPMFMLSAGSRRKAALCAALASGAPLTLLDQPFAALDLASIRTACEFLNNLASRTDRAFVVADYGSPPGVALASVINL